MKPCAKSIRKSQSCPNVVVKAEHASKMRKVSSLDNCQRIGKSVVTSQFPGFVYDVTRDLITHVTGSDETVPETIRHMGSCMLDRLGEDSFTYTFCKLLSHH